MGIVTNGRISSNDQKVDKKKFDDGFDGIKWKSKEKKDKKVEKK